MWIRTSPALAPSPSGVARSATSPPAPSVVVTNYGDDSVSFLNPDTLVVEDTIGVPGEPFAALVSDDRAYVSTSSASYDAVSVIDTNTRTVIATYPLAFGVTALAISPDGKRVYAGRTGHDHVDVAVIDTTAERVGTIDIATGAGIGVDAIAVDPTGKRLYVAHHRCPRQSARRRRRRDRPRRSQGVGRLADPRPRFRRRHRLRPHVGSGPRAAPSASSTCRPTGSPTPSSSGSAHPPR